MPRGRSRRSMAVPHGRRLRSSCCLPAHHRGRTAAPIWMAWCRVPTRSDAASATSYRLDRRHRSRSMPAAPPGACHGSAASRRARRALRHRSASACPGRTGRQHSGRCADRRSRRDRTDDELVVGVEKLARQPVELGRHVDATVQVGDDAAFEAQREGPRRLAKVDHVEEDGLALFGQLFARRRAAPAAATGAQCPGPVPSSRRGSRRWPRTSPSCPPPPRRWRSRRPRRTPSSPGRRTCGTRR